MAGGPIALPQGQVPGGVVLILCTLGTHPQPFARALDWLLPAARDEDLVVQHGATPARPEVTGARWHEFLDYDELTELVDAADVVVSHGGVGSLMTAIGLGAVPVAIPRLRAMGEHVDDHQLQIVSELGRSGHVVPCLQRDALSSALERAGGAKPPSPTRAVIWDESPRGELRRAAIIAAGGDPDRPVA